MWNHACTHTHTHTHTHRHMPIVSSCHCQPSNLCSCPVIFSSSFQIVAYYTIARWQCHLRFSPPTPEAWQILQTLERQQLQQHNQPCQQLHMLQEEMLHSSNLPNRPIPKNNNCGYVRTTIAWNHSDNTVVWRWHCQPSNPFCRFHCCTSARNLDVLQHMIQTTLVKRQNPPQNTTQVLRLQRRNQKSKHGEKQCCCCSVFFFFTLAHFCTYSKSMLTHSALWSKCTPFCLPLHHKGNKQKTHLHTHTHSHNVYYSTEKTSVSQFRPFGAWYTVNLH